MDVAFRRAVAEARRRGDLYFAGLLPEDQAPSEWRWLSRRVLDVDGSTITMPDTPEG